jgi:hypothetical protein
MFHVYLVASLIEWRKRCIDSLASFGIASDSGYTLLARTNKVDSKDSEAVEHLAQLEKFSTSDVAIPRAG